MMRLAWCINIMKSQYDLFKTHAPAGASVCFLRGGGKIGMSGRGGGGNEERYPVHSFGARVIQNELQHNFDIVQWDEIGRYDYALVSVTSVVEMQNILAATIGLDKGRCCVIAGGMGMLNPWPIYDVIDVAVFGRAEGQIMDILGGGSPGNVWRKSDDPRIEARYAIRQAETLLPNEDGIGCPRHCAFCQYTAVRRHIPGRSYRPGPGGKVWEDDWHNIVLRPGRNTTALDGLSEATRFRVKKRISNKAVMRKLQAARELVRHITIVIKLYMIIGYPWEDEETFERDKAELAGVFADADGDGARIFLMLLFTPFSPEPFTPMQSERVEFHDWNKIVNGAGRSLYKGKSIEAYVLPQIGGPLTLQKRIALNRASAENRGRVIEFVRTAREPIEGFYDVLGVGDFTGYSHLLADWER